MNAGGVGDPSDAFVILERLGSGTFGSVWLAAERQSSKLVAVKVLPLDRVVGKKTGLESIRREIHVMKTCANDCASVVRFYGSYVTPLLEAVWLVMEACECSVLDLMGATEAPLPEPALVAVAAAVTRALSYLHGEHGVIHRDVKSSNILLSHEGDPKLGDLGVATLSSNSGENIRTFVGTPLWLAPEAISTGSYDAKVDVWALGVTAIEMAEMHPPHHSLSSVARAIFLIPTSPPPALESPAAFSAELPRFVHRCLQKDPALRPSAKDLLSDPLIEQAPQTARTARPPLVELLKAARRGRTHDRGGFLAENEPLPPGLPVVNGVPSVVAGAGIGAGSKPLFREPPLVKEKSPGVGGGGGGGGGGVPSDEREGVAQRHDVRVHPENVEAHREHPVQHARHGEHQPRPAAAAVRLRRLRCTCGAQRVCHNMTDDLAGKRGVRVVVGGDERVVAHAGALQVQVPVPCELEVCGCRVGDGDGAIMGEPTKDARGRFTECSH